VSATGSVLAIRVHRGVAAESRRRGPCLHRFRVFAAGLAQVRMQVDEARQGDQAARVEGSGAGVIQVRPMAVTDPPAIRMLVAFSSRPGS